MNIQNNTGKSALIRAASYGRLSCLECLVSHGADVNIQNRDGDTALWWAGSYGQCSVLSCME